MPKDPRERMIFDCPERYRRAIRIRMAADGKESVSEVLLEMMDKFLLEEIRQADERLKAAKRVK